MRFNIARLFSLVIVFLILIFGWGPPLPVYDAVEGKASLFDNEGFRGAPSKVDVTGASLNIEPTVNKWTGIEQWAGAARGGLEDLARLVSFTSTAYGAPIPTSATSGSDGPVGCSAVGQNQAQLTACSTNDGGGTGSGWTAGCSTASSGTATPQNGTTTCSAFVPAAPVNNNNNVTCSAAGAGNGAGTVNNCSAGGTTGSTGCSTAGGQSQPGNSNGAVGCSAMANGLVGGGTCSTTAGAATVACSTFGGLPANHQSCSAGNAAAGHTATCSATGALGKGTTANCSVNAAGTNTPGVYGNQCTAIAFGNNVMTGTATCSTQGAATTAACSVAAGNTGGTNNTQCTAIPAKGAAAPPAGYTCSASGGAPKNSCSVIQPNGTATPPTPPALTCGGPYTGE